MVHGRFWLVNVIRLLNCDNERDLCQLLDAAFVVGCVQASLASGLWICTGREGGAFYLLGLCAF